MGFSECFWHKCSHKAAKRVSPGAPGISRLSRGQIFQTQSHGVRRSLPASALWLLAGHLSSLPHGLCYKTAEWGMRERSQDKPQSFYNLISEVTSPHFCLILNSRRENYTSLGAISGFSEVPSHYIISSSSDSPLNQIQMWCHMGLVPSFELAAHSVRWRDRLPVSCTSDIQRCEGKGEPL